MSRIREQALNQSPPSGPVVLFEFRATMHLSSEAPR